MSSSNIEYELRVLEINMQALASKIENLGGKLLGNYYFRRYVFNTIPVQHGKWLRLRTDGTRNTLTLKEITKDTVDGTSEWEIEVGDFDATYEFLTKIGFKSKAYQENTRVEYLLRGAKVALDSWPLIPPYLEIEANDKKTVKECASLLGYTDKDLTGENTQKIYLKYGIDIESKAMLQFPITKK